MTRSKRGIRERLWTVNVLGQHNELPHISSLSRTKMDI